MITDGLALRLPYRLDEFPCWFVSRLAARNGRPTKAFAADMGLDSRRIVDGQADAVERLAALGDVRLTDLMHETQIRGVDGSYALRDQELRTADLRRSRILICPECLADDIASSDLPPSQAAYGRMTWTLANIRTCAIHGLALMEVVKDVISHNFPDWCEHVASALKNLPKLAASAARRPASTLETYISDRLEGRPTSSWLDRFPLFAACHVAETMGAVASFGTRVNLRKLSEDQRYVSGHAGADIAAGGESAVVSLLSDLHRTYLDKRTGDAATAQGVFGRLYTVPAGGMVGPAYDPLRSVIRGYLSDRFALGPGDHVFGSPVPERRWHSVRTASKEYGLTPKRLRKIVQAEGLISDPSLPDRDVLFDAQIADRIFRREQDMISRNSVRGYINASVTMTRVLIDDGFIPLHAAGAGMNNFCLKSEIDALMTRLTSSADPVSATPGGTAPIAQAAKRSYRPSGTIIRLILEGGLAWVGRLEGKSGFDAILVDVEEVKIATKSDDLPGLPVATVAADVLKTNWRVMEQLIEAEAISVQAAIDPLTRIPTRIITYDELDRFRKRYVSLHALSKETGSHMNALNRSLQAKGIMPVEFSVPVNATFYRRDEVDLG